MKLWFIILGLMMWPLSAFAVAPAARAHHAGAYNSATGETLIYGGYVYDPSAPNRARAIGDIWSWNGKVWHLVADTGQAQIAPGMVYDSKRDRVLMFSSDDNGRLSFLEGDHWTPLAEDNYLARVGAGMVYDVKRDQVLMFGGRRGHVLLADTWVFDGRAWNPTWMAGPSLRDPTAIAYDNSRGITVLYGGFRPLAALADTWEWNGKAWNLIASKGPGSRAWPGLAYDNRRQRTILFSGEDDKGRFLADTWAYDGHVWKKIAAEGPPPANTIHHDL